MRTEIAEAARITRVKLVSSAPRRTAVQVPVRLHQYFEQRAADSPHATALVAGPERLTYAQLDARANRLAHYLLGHGAGPGRTVGILLERSAYTYVALLGILKSGSAFVPIDASYPADRVAFIAGDAGLTLLVTTSDLAAGHPDLPCPVVRLDEAGAELDRMSVNQPVVPDEGDDLAYIIYTSGTTGRPKGVAVNHSNICHFLSVVTPIYGVTPADRVYQGMTIAFDFSIEEIWPTFVAGAALVAGPTDSRRLGPGLADFLDEHRVTMFYCVPTLLATLDREVPAVRTLIVGGEACPRDLVERWSRPGRRMLNTYGPTETTVTATWSELEPGRPVTIGRPLPGYTVRILDEKLRPVADGESGEISIGGAGVAVGYMNRPDLTASKFIETPSGRMYRSGDLGRIAPNGEIEFLGRIDTQVKIRGYRIELSEIEAVMVEDPAIECAVAAPVSVGGAPVEIAVYVTLRSPEPLDELRERLARTLRSRLPVYMVPAYIEVLAAIPMLASGKADRKSLPVPVLSRVVLNGGGYVAPETALERKIAAVWYDTFGRQDISADADFFLDLGGHSLFAAQLVSKLRTDPELRRLSVADLYANPSIRALAQHASQCAEEPAGATVPGAAPIRHSSRRVWGAGAAQFALLYAVLAILGAPAAAFIAEHSRQRSMFAVTGFDLLLPLILMLVSTLLPVVLKWTVAGRLSPGQYPLWGWDYCRWWMLRKALDFSPMPFLAGSPLLNVYARLLGAKIGRGAHIATPQLHMPDFVEIGEGASIGYEVEIQPFQIVNGWLQVAPVRIGEGAFVGAKSVIMPGAEIGRNARISEQTLVTGGQKIPAGETWAGSPARRAAVTDPLLDEMEARPVPARKLSSALWAGFAAAFLFIAMLPFAVAVPGLLLMAYADSIGGWPFALAVAPCAGLAFVVTTCTVVFAGKRLAMPRLRPGIYPVDSWFGIRKWVADKLMLLSLTLTNTLYATLYTLPWLRSLGARIGPRSEVSTVSHIDPDLLRLGTEVFVADIASIGAATFHNGYIAMNVTEVGDRTFLGNASVIRSHAALPDNCLIGVQSVVPAVPAEPGTSWLGSPAIFLPKRQVVEGFAENLTYRPTVRLYLYRLAVELVRIVLPPALLYVLGAGVVLTAVRLVDRMPAAALAAVMPALFLASSVLVTGVVAALKWAIVGRYRPRVEPLWAPFVRHSELVTGLYESVAVPTLLHVLTGSPWIAPVLRLFGVRIGRRVCLETTFMTEFDLVRLGDDSAVGRASSLQTHLFEDRVMKMSVVRVGAGASVGPRSIVLYDSTIGDGAWLDGLSLAMKGESIPAETSWRGVPARLVE
jgi:non-ribosomal peptide synthetase-like protein